MNKKNNGSHNNEMGATLIEVMLSVIILAVIAVAGGAGVYLSRNSIAKEKDRNAALTEAIRIMELVRNTAELRGAETGSFYEDPANEGSLLLGNLNWSNDINGISRPITGHIDHYEDAPSPYDATINATFNEITVTVGYQDDTAVALKTIITDSD